MKHFILSVAALALVGATAVPSRAESRVDFDGGAPSVHDIVAKARAAARADKTPEPAGVQLGAQGNDQLERSIVVFKKGTSAQSRIQSIESLGGAVTNDLWLINAVAVAAPKSGMMRIQSALASAPNVLRVERDYVQNWLRGAPALAAPSVRAALPPPAAADVPRAQALPWGIQRVNAQAAWAVTRGQGVKVAVVDTGIDFDHPDLKVAGGANIIDPKASFKDDNGHGTHVSGTIAGQGKGDVWGVAPDVSLYGVKVLDANGSGTFANVIAGIQWTAQNHMDVANFSLGADQGTQALADAIKAASDAGVTIVAAAGNSGGDVGFPAAYPQCIAVAASDSKDAVADFSSRGPQVAVIAPGVDVYSTYMGGGYETLSGTSMATPHVTGLVALAIAAHGIHGQGDVRKALVGAARKFPNVPPEQQGAGMVDAGALVR